MTATITEIAPAAERAARGAALLDTVMPGWAARINIDTLAIKSDTLCILGQLYSRPGVCCGYCAGLSALDDMTSGDAKDHGFNMRTPDGLGIQEYCDAAEADANALTEAWQDLIATRVLIAAGIPDAADL